MTERIEAKIGDFVLLPDGRAGRWSLTNRDGLALVVSGDDVRAVEPGQLRLAFESSAKSITGAVE